ncbi:MAG: hypothetical protein ACTSRP_19940 [Candidatus Helarchaeota archaeon]
MEDVYVPRALIEYYDKINGNWEKLNLPRCPICNSIMEYIDHEFMEIKNEIGVIRKFKCVHCIEKEVILWRK